MRGSASASSPALATTEHQNTSEFASHVHGSGTAFVKKRKSTELERRTQLQRGSASVVVSNVVSALHITMHINIVARARAQSALPVPCPPRCCSPPRRVRPMRRAGTREIAAAARRAAGRAKATRSEGSRRSWRVLARGGSDRTPPLGDFDPTEGSRAALRL